MKKRFENRIRKALRIAQHLEPAFVRLCQQLEQSSFGLPLALTNLVADRSRPAHQRVQAAELLSIAGEREAFTPILEHFLECDSKVPWDIEMALPNLEQPHRSYSRAISEILKKDPDEERRAAAVQVLLKVNVPGRTRVLVSVLENANETGYVRGRAAEMLTRIERTGPIEAIIRCLKDADPAVRFWSVFALGVIASRRPHLHLRARAALRPMLTDEVEVPGYWSIGREAQAMIEDIQPEARRHGEVERQAILSNPQTPPSLKRWAEFYSDSEEPTCQAPSYIQSRYRGLRWLRFSQKPGA